MSVRALLLFVALVVITAGCTQASDQSATAPAAPSTSVSAVTTTLDPVQPLDAESFGGFVNDVGWTLLRRSPQDITDLGLDALMSARQDQLDDLSPEYRRETTAIARNALARLDTLDAATLSADEVVTASVLRWYLEDIVTMAGFADHEYAANYITGAHANFPEFMADVHPVTSLSTADDYIDRIRAAGDQMRQVADNVRRSAAKGIEPTARGREIALWQISNVLGPAARSNPLVSDFADRLALVPAISTTAQGTLVTEASSAVNAELLPGYRELEAVLRDVDVRSDSSPGVLDLPGGDDYYRAVLRHHLTLDITPQEVHELGQTNVDRLVSELTVALGDVGYDVQELGFAGAVGAARDDGGTFPLTNDSERDALLDHTTAAIDEASAAVQDMFVAFPDSELVVQRPRPGREGGSGAYYRAPPAYGDRPGIYYLSLGDSSMDIQTYATTNYHEAIPGHHFQLAIQRESTTLPLLQRSAVFTGFAEGWGLYAERLAFEAGLYADDPQGNIGRLRMELLRASRAVVDTGIHHLGWSYDEALEYMTDLGFSEDRSRSEIDRYVVWPGQAPAYLVGMLEILRLRSEAQEALGDGFDLAAFHTELLRHGSVPLEALSPIVDGYIVANS